MGYEFRRRGFCALLLSPAVGWASPAKSDIVIGQSAPLSGPMAPFIKSVLAGQKAAFDDANEAGGIGGRKLRLVIRDDGFDPKRTAANLNALAEADQAVAFLSTVGTAQTAAVLPLLSELKIPLIGAYTGSPALRTVDNRYFFTTQASYLDELVKMVRNLVTLQSTRIAVVYQDNEFGKGMLPLAEKVIAAEGAKVAAKSALASTGANAENLARELARVAPSAVVLIAAGPPVVDFVRANKAHVGVPIYTFSLAAGATVLDALGEAARGLAVARVTPFPWQATTPLIRQYTASMAKHKLPLDYDTLNGYLNARIMLECIRRAGVPVSPKAVLNVLETNGKFDLGGFELAFDAQHRHGSRFVELTVIGSKGNTLK
jgi:branched-chain amino acid transport system substrate-binding protein